jgi:hypothetical protein
VANLAVEIWLRFVVWLVLGLIVYVGYSRTHARLADPATFDAKLAEAAGTPARMSPAPPAHRRSTADRPRPGASPGSRD